MSLPVILLVAAVFVATGLGFFNKLLGGIAGVVICVGVGVWGTMSLRQGATIAFLGKELSQTEFYLLIAALIVVNIVQIVRGAYAPRR